MDLQSALGVREELVETFSRHRGGVRGGPRNFALGVAPGSRPMQYRVAVRAESADDLRPEALDEIERAAAGEVEVRYVGRIQANSGCAASAMRGPAIGASVGHFLCDAGTLGFFAAKQRPEHRFRLEQPCHRRRGSGGRSRRGPSSSAVGRWGPAARRHWAPRRGLPASQEAGAGRRLCICEASGRQGVRPEHAARGTAPVCDHRRALLSAEGEQDRTVDRDHARTHFGIRSRPAGRFLVRQNPVRGADRDRAERRFSLQLRRRQWFPGVYHRRIPSRWASVRRFGHRWSHELRPGVRESDRCRSERSGRYDDHVTGATLEETRAAKAKLAP